MLGHIVSTSELPISNQDPKQSEYEFNKTENKLISDLGSNLRKSGWVGSVLAAGFPSSVFTEVGSWRFSLERLSLEYHLLASSCLLLQHFFHQSGKNIRSSC